MGFAHGSSRGEEALRWILAAQFAARSEGPSAQLPRVGLPFSKRREEQLLLSFAPKTRYKGDAVNGRRQTPSVREIAPRSHRIALLHKKYRALTRVGRFISPDPLGHAASMSLYDYANGDPVNFVDPTGRRAGAGGKVTSTEFQQQLLASFDGRPYNPADSADVNRNRFLLRASSFVGGSDRLGEAGDLWDQVVLPQLKQSQIAYQTGMDAMQQQSHVAAQAKSSMGFQMLTVGAGLINLTSDFFGLTAAIGERSQAVLIPDGNGGYTMSLRTANVSAGDRAWSLLGSAPLLLVGGPEMRGAKGSLRFTQSTASPMFSAEGWFAGRSISQVASDLRLGAMSAADVPVEFIVRDGNRLIVNTRSALALRQAGIPEPLWNLINQTGVPEVEASISKRLFKNELGNSGTDVLRITGSGSGASTYTWP